MNMQSDYDQCLKTMFGLRRFGIKLGLETIREILRGLGNPQKKFLSVHVAGTNGKGSIASYIARILRESGRRVGLYTSPHLVRFNERIQIDGELISDEEVLNAHEAVKNVEQGEREPTFFEYTTAMAFYEFARRNVDWAVVETGMGGRLDATNAIAPKVSVISNISVEHKMYLGGSLAKIAAEKGGVIKPEIPVVTGVNQKSVIAVLERIANENKAPIFRLGKDFRVRRHKKKGIFSYSGIDSDLRELEIKLCGRHQFANAALSLAACELLNRENAQIKTKDMRQGLFKTKWPGRLEIVSRSPMVLLDGAHNLMAARNLAKYISSNYPRKHVTMVIGILDDKPYRSMLKSLLQVSGRVILTRPVIDRALHPERLYECARHYAEDVQLIPEVKTAVFHALESAGSEETICIAGSLYVVGEAREALKNRDRR